MCVQYQFILLKTSGEVFFVHGGRTKLPGPFGGHLTTWMHLHQEWCLFPPALVLSEQLRATWSSFCRCSPESWAPSWPPSAQFLLTSQLYISLICLARRFFGCLVLWAWPFPKEYCDLWGFHHWYDWGSWDCYKPLVPQGSCVNERQAGSLFTSILLILVFNPCLFWNLHLAPTEVSYHSS